MKDNIIKAYELAKEKYAGMGVDTQKAMDQLIKIPLSMHCWQGDDVAGFENTGQELSGGIQVTGAYPGKARTIDELQKDIEKAYSLIPGKHRLNLHAFYLDNGGKSIDRDQIEPEHFKTWVDWAKEHCSGMDFNPSMFSHPKSDSGFTLSSTDKGIRDFWIEHCKRSRKIGEYFGRELKSACVTNIWAIDGYKDVPVDRLAPRQRLMEALDEIIKGPIDKKYNIDAVESKLFGIGLGKLCGGLARVLHGLRRKPRHCLMPGRGALPPDRSHIQQNIFRRAFYRPASFACQPPGPLGQRPCGDTFRRTARDRPRDNPQRAA